MTIDISNNNPRISYSVAAGITQNTFTVPFEFFADTNLNVYVDEVLQTITTDYTVSGGDGSTGTITMTVIGPKTVLISRDTTIERTTDFTAGVDINRAALNTQLDTLTAISADVKDLAERSIRIKDFDPSTGSLELPSATERADKIISFDTEGNVQTQSAADLLLGPVLGANYIKVSYTGDGSTVAFSTTSSAGSKNNIQVYIDGVYQNKDTFSIDGATLTFSEAPPLNSSIEFIVGNAVTSYSTDIDVITYDQGSTGAQERSLASRLQDTVSVKDFGAAGDGVTDDTAAIQTAINSGLEITVPAGTYKLASTLYISGTEKTLVCQNDVTFAYTGTANAITITGDEHRISLGLVTAQNGTECIVYYNLSNSIIKADALGVCSNAVILHDASLQTENEGNCIWDIHRLEGGSVPYGLKIDSHASFTHEGNEYKIKVLYSATTAGVVIGTSGNNTVRWNEFDVAPDAQGITPIMFDVYCDSNAINCRHWQGFPSGTHIRFNTGVTKNQVIAQPGVQTALNIVDNGSNFALFPSANGAYEIQQGKNYLVLDDGTVGLELGSDSGGGGVRFTTGGTERLRISDIGVMTQKNNTLPAFMPCAWVNYTDVAGTPTIAGSGNVASLTDNGTGTVTVTFTTAMPDTNYSVIGTAAYTGASVILNIASKSTGSFQVITAIHGAGAVDATFVGLMVIR